MRKLVTMTAGAVMLAGAAQAATFQYDITMQRTDLGFYSRVFAQDGTIPPPNEALYDIAPLSEYEPTISATFTLDDRYTIDRYQGSEPTCVGSFVICDFVPYRGNLASEPGIISATADGFLISPASTSFLFNFDQDGLFYGNDGTYGFEFDGVTFNADNGLFVSYETTDLITTTVPAPVPLPASMPLLALGLAAFGWVTRRHA